MARLVSRELLGLLQIVRDVHEASDAHDLGAQLTVSLRALVGADNCTYSDLSPLHNRVRVEIFDPVGDRSSASQAAFARYMHEHPIVVYFAATGDGRARMTSDFLSRRALHRLALYNEYVRPFVGTEFQIATAMTAEPSRVVGITLARSRRDFTERDRAVLNLLRPHVVQATRTIALLDRLTQQIASLEHSLEVAALGVIQIDRRRRVRAMTPAARHLMGKYFGSTRRPDVLPEEVRRWMRHQESSHTRDDAPPVRLPLVIRRGTHTLEVRLVPDGDGRQLMLKQEVLPTDRTLCERLGLTVQEARVLSWVAEGKTSAETAAILGGRPRTVEKHLERIYRKLGVENRHSASALVRTLGTGA